MNTTSGGTSSAGRGGPRLLRRFRTDVRTLVVLVACSAVTLWALRRLWENHDPLVVQSRSIQKQAISTLRSGKASERVTAIHELERLGSGDGTIAIPPLIERSRTRKPKCGSRRSKP